ncbi:hypothetical protein BH11PSE11_BH11PSE11_12710 [soil metagenome]
MLKSTSPVLTQNQKNSGKSIYVRNLSAALIAAATHLYLIHLVDIEVVRTRGLALDQDKSGNAIAVTLITPEMRPPKRDLELVSSVAPTPRPSIHPPSPADTAEQPPPVIDLLLPPDTEYFPTTVLTEKPVVVKDIPPDLAALLKNRAANSAVLRLQINEQGSIDQVIVDFSQFSEDDQKLLIEAFSKLQFAPGKIDGIPVKSQMRIEIKMERVTPVATLATPFPDLR